METSTINQLINTGGLFIIAIFSVIFYSRIIKKQIITKKEINYLKDIIFLNKIIKKYRAENLANGEKENYLTFRKEATKDLGYTASDITQNSRIIKKLEWLKKYDEELEVLKNNITSN